MGNLANITALCSEVMVISAHKVRVQQNFNKNFSLEI